MRIDVRDAHHGPLMVEMAMARVVAKTDRKRIGPEEVLVVLRVVEPSGALKYDYYLSNAAVDTPCEEFARVAKAEHRIEECIQRAKGEAGLADYEVRSWAGWHHHQTLSLIATWFLVKEAKRGKKIYASNDGSASSHDPGLDDSTPSWLWRTGGRGSQLQTSLRADSAGTMVSLERSELVGAFAP